jgi:hypothetical protein
MRLVLREEEEGQFGELQETVGVESPLTRLVPHGAEDALGGHPRHPTVRRSRVIRRFHFQIR